jgi:nitroreductase
MLNSIIKSRRTIKPAHFNGEHVTDDQVLALLDAADWAPTHKFTEPWRFLVFSPERVPGFCFEHAALYKAHTPEDEFEQSKFDKLLHLGDKASHIVIVYTKPSPGNRLPLWEEMAATACALQNLLLSAHEAGIAAFWSTGGMSAKPQFKTWLELDETDVPMAILYLGRSNETPVGVRRIPLQDKIRWER